MLIASCGSGGGSSSGKSEKNRLDVGNVDKQLFERTDKLFSLFREKSNKIWQESYRLDQMALMYVRNDGRRDQYAYLINHPKVVGIESAQRYKVPADFNLPPVYRLDKIPNQEKIAKIENFDFNYDVHGVETYVMKYTSPDINEFKAPTSDVWTLYVAHEGFHDYQLDTWREAPGNGQDIAGYPLNSEHIALIMLEDAVIKEALQADSPAGRTRAIKQFVAIRQTRIATWDDVRYLDLPQEQIEGTARYIEHRLGSLIGYDKLNLNTFADGLGYIPESNIRGELGFGRFYRTGAALGYLLDQLNIDWKIQIERGQSQFDVISDYYNIANDGVPALLSEAKAAYHYDTLKMKAKDIAKVVASEPTDIFAGKSK